MYVFIFLVNFAAYWEIASHSAYGFVLLLLLFFFFVCVFFFFFFFFFQYKYPNVNLAIFPRRFLEWAFLSDLLHTLIFAYFYF